jgi:hypothetical protein
VALYTDVLFKRLQIPKDFLLDHAKAVRDKLRIAAADVRREHDDLFAINQCLHLASSVVLRNPSHLGETLTSLRAEEGLEDQDPTTIVTVAALYYLILSEADQVASEKQNAKVEEDRMKASENEIKLKRLRNRFDNINWLIGKDAMRALGIESYEQ